MKVSRNCKRCQVEYTTDTRYLKRGQGEFCSRKCSANYLASVRPKPEPNVTCAYCGTLFYLPFSKRRKSKSGLFFCCRSHKDISQKIGGIRDIMPPHYGTSLKSYRTLAFENLPVECARCAWKEVPEVLEVNHKDCDRTNNSLSNLEILCPTCHSVYHFTTKTGMWAKSTV